MLRRWLLWCSVGGRIGAWIILLRRIVRCLRGRLVSSCERGRSAFLKPAGHACKQGRRSARKVVLACRLYSSSIMTIRRPLSLGATLLPIVSIVSPTLSPTSTTAPLLLLRVVLLLVFGILLLQLCGARLRAREIDSQANATNDQTLHVRLFYDPFGVLEVLKVHKPVTPILAGLWVFDEVDFLNGTVPLQRVVYLVRLAPACSEPKHAEASVFALDLIPEGLRIKRIACANNCGHL